MKGGWGMKGKGKILFSASLVNLVWSAAVSV